MTYLLRFTTIIVALLSISMHCEACRFTVREIGFSALSQTNYTFVIIDNTTASNATLEALHTYKKNSNIGVLHLNESVDYNNPIVQLAKNKGVVSPSIFFLSPNNHIYIIEDNIQDGIKWKQVEKLFKTTVLESPLREKLRIDSEKTFAQVICIDGVDQEKNKDAMQLINIACRELQEIMPLMPKEVAIAPSVLRITEAEFNQERVLLWSLGVDSLAKEPQAIIIYGRGRVMGNILNYNQIKDSLVFKYLSMIGADCECGLDRKWMLGVQIPMVWDRNCRQNLAVELGFDVDNPTILAEMSRIMSKERVEDGTLAVGYGLESIDLNEAFNINVSKPKVILIQEDKNQLSGKVILYSLLSLIVISLIISTIIINRKKRGI